MRRRVRLWNFMQSHVSGLTSILPGHKYGYVSCIAYVVATDKFDLFHFINASGNPAIGTNTKYSGDLNDLADYNDKCQRMTNAIDAAFKQYEEYKRLNPAGPVDDETLKVFMAPEFFSGAGGVPMTTRPWTRYLRNSGVSPGMQGSRIGYSCLARSSLRRSTIRWLAPTAIRPAPGISGGSG